MNVLTAAASLACASPPNQIREELLRYRRVRTTGVGLGAGLVTTSFALGIADGAISPVAAAAAAGVGLTAAAAVTWSHNEARPPLSDSRFVVQDSLIPFAGQGLFAASPVREGEYLFEYAGERLSEEEYFERYRSGEGRYVAVVDTLALLGEPIYTDAADPARSGIARWMNSLPEGECNVRKRKQRFGGQRGRMFFYAARPIEPGEELTFDYGAAYWDAVSAQAAEVEPEEPAADARRLEGTTSANSGQ
mmetsp:Transcript_17195/g.55501  ORF Transcript_17195/g.55501 Transcript_17195/m.55501 type:complete len:249 (-) Transcript_17195:186-932(-)